ncbi:hypothetical protein TNIN_471181 [Trichonephila inaurata madagascariensis]|uniref:Triple QxxK/R motif-containing protein n=1 Tax=Trichonephila inaurata madagascariensis TaxID=2747483 RepID=A0A8X6YE23_9ARAC|nr:hypothetical protein TNIN_471181 [Trichonephila inaurata madagascariensis]
MCCLINLQQPLQYNSVRVCFVSISDFYLDDNCVNIRLFVFVSKLVLFSRILTLFIRQRISHSEVTDMGKNKDSTKDVPIQNYRKQIGKQDYKKSKTELKEVKARAQAKKCSGSVYKIRVFLSNKGDYFYYFYTHNDFGIRILYSLP